MDIKHRIVTTSPLTILWNDSSEIQATRKHYLTKEQIRQILKETPVEFVVADVGLRLKWVEASQCYSFWKSEAESHIADGDLINIDSFPDKFAYVASEWQANGGIPIILLEKQT
ncbi:MAG: hypothetical protein IT262_03560 [Saprospiraceae bacterium]|nr:hypothetical protein [Saprospiraceae bacterium]